MCALDFSWVLLNAHESSWVPMSAHECSWALRRAHECWWVIQSAQVLDPVLNQKCQLFKMVPCSILTISWSRFNQIIKSRILLKSTWKGLLKNVQDEISRPLGSQEIQKTKALPVLRDTLYVFSHNPTPSQILVSFHLTTFFKTSLFSLLYFLCIPWINLVDRHHIS